MNTNCIQQNQKKSNEYSRPERTEEENKTQMKHQSLVWVVVLVFDSGRNVPENGSKENYGN